MNHKPGPGGPPKIDQSSVVCWTRIDPQRQPTGKTRHYVGGEHRTDIAGLTIGRYSGDPGFYLFYCDADWKPITDTWHSSLEDAKRQAEFEFAGVSSTWVGPKED